MSVQCRPKYQVPIMIRFFLYKILQIIRFHIVDALVYFRTHIL